ncbi:MAG: hypothetical protein AAF821_19305 [Cyanobacteria bacterium P01_D01_bin.156]
MRFPNKSLLILAACIAVVLFTGSSLLAQSTSVTVEELQRETSIPVLIPDATTLAMESPLYPEIMYSGPEGYYVAYGWTEHCADAGFCNHARVKGYRIGSTVSHFKPESLEALIAERTEVLAEAPYRSPDPIETISLTDGSNATVLPWYSYTNPGNTEVIFEREGIRYLFAIEMAPNAEVIAMANSALMGSPQ